MIGSLTNLFIFSVTVLFSFVVVCREEELCCKLAKDHSSKTRSSPSPMELQSVSLATLSVGGTSSLLLSFLSSTSFFILFSISMFLARQ